MANYCFFCGEEIPDDEAICNICTVILNSLSPNQQKKILRVFENEEAMAKLRAGLREVKLQMRTAIAPIVAAIIDLIDTVIDVTEEGDDGNEKPTA